MENTFFDNDPEFSEVAKTSPEKRTKDEVFNDYDAFVEKFKTKKTTDDCYTPTVVYNCVLQGVNDNIMPLRRPFLPIGGMTRRGSLVGYSACMMERDSSESSVHRNTPSFSRMYCGSPRKRTSSSLNIGS